MGVGGWAELPFYAMACLEASQVKIGIFSVAVGKLSSFQRSDHYPTMIMLFNKKCAKDWNLSIAWMAYYLRHFVCEAIHKLCNIKF